MIFSEHGLRIIWGRVFSSTEALCYKLSLRLGLYYSWKKLPIASCPDPAKLSSTVISYGCKLRLLVQGVCSSCLPFLSAALLVTHSNSTVSVVAHHDSLLVLVVLQHTTYEIDSLLVTHPNSTVLVVAHRDSLLVSVVTRHDLLLVVHLNIIALVILIWLCLKLLVLTQQSTVVTICLCMKLLLQLNSYYHCTIGPFVWSCPLQLNSRNCFSNSTLCFSLSHQHSKFCRHSYRHFLKQLHLTQQQIVVLFWPFVNNIRISSIWTWSCLKLQIQISQLTSSCLLFSNSSIAYFQQIQAV